MPAKKAELTYFLDGIHVDMNHLKNGEVKSVYTKQLQIQRSANFNHQLRDFNVSGALSGLEF